MKFKDKATWESFVAKNMDPYGAGVVQYAEQWADLMETRIAEGKSVTQMAEETSFIAAKGTGLSGFQYGCAVAILSQVWLYGEALRQWHNLHTQLGTEGERANQSGGVLNPALIRLEQR